MNKTKKSKISNNPFSIEIDAPIKAKGIDPKRQGVNNLRLRLPDLIQFIELPDTTIMLQNNAIIGKM